MFASRENPLRLPCKTGPVLGLRLISHNDRLLKAVEIETTTGKVGGSFIITRFAGQAHIRKVLGTLREKKS